MTNQSHDIVERLRLANSNFYDEAAEEIESLRQQLAEANNQVNQLNNMMRDKGFGQGEIDTMGWYEQQLAEYQERLGIAQGFDMWKANPYTAELEQQLAEWNRFFSEWKSPGEVHETLIGLQKDVNALNEYLTKYQQQLAECQAREKVMIRYILDAA